MHQWSLSELWGVSTWRGAPARGTTGGRASRSSGPSGGSAPRRLRPPRGASLWAWLLLGALVPGAWSFLNEVQEELLVELHNHYRGQVSPTASAMLPLKWDPNLKLVAESYAAKCIWNHNPDLEDTGENLFAGTGPVDLREALEKWFLERLDYNYENNSCDEDKMCGHYTQMVWADTHRVGCAFHLCNMMEGLDWERVSFLVCNYYPAGNFETVRPYEEGECCSSCPDNLQLCENNLCVAANMGDDEEEVDAEEEEGELYENRGTATPPQATSDPSIQSGEEKAWELMTVLPRSDHDTPSPSTPPPGTLSPVETEEEKMEEEEEEKEKTSGKKDAEKKTDESKEDVYDAGSVASPSLVLACLTGILMLRL